MSYYLDFREYLSRLEKAGKLVRVRREINKDTELMPLVRLQFRGLPEEDRRAFLFERVADGHGRRYSMPVVIGALAASREIYALGMGCHPEEVMERWTEALRHPIPPRLVSRGPVQEVIIEGDALERDGLGLIPIPISTPGYDNAPYTTATHWVTKDPETGVRNMGNYRSQIKGARTAGVFVYPTQHIGVHWEKCRKLGVPLQGALVIGGPPSVAYTAVSKIPYGVDELAVAGGIAGEPLELVKCHTVDLEVPAHAEIVIEGEIATDFLEPEAPFGEYCGYMGDRVMNPVVRVTAITYRKDAHYVGILSQMPPSESSKIRQIAYEHQIYKFLKYDCNLPTVSAVAFHESSGSWGYVVIQMRRTNVSDPWRALMAASAFDATVGKILITVDEDIDPWDPDSVNWALSFRMMPHRDLKVIRGKGSMLDHSASPPGIIGHLPFPDLEGTSAVLMDATRKWAYPPVSLPKQPFMERALEIWKEEKLPALRLKRPWYGYELGYWPAEFEEEAQLALKGEHYRTGEKLATRRVYGVTLSGTPEERR